MFTGIVDHAALLTKVEKGDGFARLEIDSHFSDLQIGESISFDGCCLTVVSFTGGRFLVELSAETLQRTTAANYQVGSLINLERAMRLGDRLGGHIVTGHIDATGHLVSREAVTGCTRFHFGGVSEVNQSFVIEKGSIAVNGISLTINDIFEDGFSVMVIPHTSQRTQIDTLVPGSKVNLEFDWMTKVILNDARARRQLLKNKTS